MQKKSDKIYSYAAAVTSNTPQLPRMETVSAQPTKKAKVKNITTSQKLSLSLHKPRPLSQHNKQVTSHKSTPSQQSRLACSTSIQTKRINASANHNKQNNPMSFIPKQQQQAYHSPPSPKARIDKDENLSHVGIPSTSATTCSQAPLSAR